MGFSLYVSNSTDKDVGYLCLKNTQFPTPKVNIDCVVHGQFVTFYNERKPGDPLNYSKLVYNEICEVEVYGKYKCISNTTENWTNYHKNKNHRIIKHLQLSLLFRRFKLFQ